MLQSDIRRYDYIDAIRGMAILGVILVHSCQAVAPTNTKLLWVMTEGARGVQLFFVASALALCMSWVARSPHEASPIRSFYIRRFFRIAPMFYLAILTYMFLNGSSPAYWSPNGIKWWFVLLTATFLHGFHPETITSVVPGGWSIAVEMSFYLILPFMLAHIKSLKSCLIFFIISLGLYGLNGLVTPQVFLYPEDQQYLVQYFSYFDLLGQLPVFVLGISCYFVLREEYPRRQIAIAGGALFVILLLAFVCPVPQLPHHLVAGGLFSVFTLLLANWPTRLLVNRITTTLGKLSYSMYLTHFAVLKYFSLLGFSGMFPRSNLASVLHFVCVVLVASIVSFFFYKFIEKPGIALGKRIIGKLEQDSRRNPNAPVNLDAAP